MAAVLDWPELTVRLYKRAVGNPDFEWVNTYELHLGAPLNDWAEMSNMLDAFVLAERQIHYNVVEYTRATVSTWVPEDPAAGYDPYSFAVKEFSAGEHLGARDPSSINMLPRNAVLSVRRQVVTGRSGRVFYRGALNEGEVTAGTSLDWQLTSGAKTTIDTILGTIYSDMTAAAAFYGGGTGFMALIGNIDPENPESDVIWRAVTGFDARGVAVRKTDHKYFDRPTP